MCNQCSKETKSNFGNKGNFFPSIIVHLLLAKGLNKLEDVIIPKTNSLVFQSRNHSSWVTFLRQTMKQQWVIESCCSKILQIVTSHLARSAEPHWSRTLPTNGRWNQYLGHLGHNLQTNQPMHCFHQERSTGQAPAPQYRQPYRVWGLLLIHAPRILDPKS